MGDGAPRRGTRMNVRCTSPPSQAAPPLFDTKMDAMKVLLLPLPLLGLKAGSGQRMAWEEIKTAGRGMGKSAWPMEVAAAASPMRHRRPEVLRKPAPERVTCVTALSVLVPALPCGTKGGVTALRVSGSVQATVAPVETHRVLLLLLPGDAMPRARFSTAPGAQGRAVENTHVAWPASALTVPALAVTKAE